MSVVIKIVFSALGIGVGRRERWDSGSGDGARGVGCGVEEGFVVVGVGRTWRRGPEMKDWTS